jgi:hypothetical protein
MEKELLIVDTSNMNVFTFCTEETKQVATERALDHELKNIELSKRYVKEYDTEDNHYWANRLKEEVRSVYIPMTWETFYQAQKEYYLSGEPKEITAEIFEDMLDVLPPLKWGTIDGVEMFLMSEFYTGTYTSQYARKGDKYYTKMVDAFDKSTWINNLI